MRCTCGAFPPEDAQFCHKCGRPLREDEPEPQPVDSPAPAPPVVTPAAPVARGIAINFRNRRAVAVSIMVAAVTLLLLLPMSMVAPSLAPVLFAGGGFLASQLYRRGSGEPFTPQNGARMGFMTSLWSFLVLLVIYTAFAAMVASPDTRHMFQLQLTQLQSNPQAAEIARILDNPRQFILASVEGMFGLFCLWTLLSMAGGMFGASVGRNR